MQLRVYLTILLGCASLPFYVSAQQPTPIAEILSPALGESVETKDQITIKMHCPGKPIVAIRSTQRGSKWWIQDDAESNGSQTFHVPATFGNDQTPAGSRFQIAVLVSTSADGAMKIQPGVSLDQLPQHLPRVAVDEVVLGRKQLPNQGPTLTVELVSPTPKSEAKRIQLVSLSIKEASEELPRLVVRSAEKGSLWWVQEPLQKSDDGDVLNGVARLGNEKTPTGSEFLLMLVRPDNDLSRKLLKTGGTLDDLTGFQHSKTFSLIAGLEGKASPTASPAPAPVALTSN